MNVEIGTEAAQFPEKEYITGIFLAVHLKVLTRSCLFSLPSRYFRSKTLLPSSLSYPPTPYTGLCSWSGICLDVQMVACVLNNTIGFPPDKDLSSSVC